MLQQTRGLVLRAIKYGETSLICTIFTEAFGVQSYIVQGVRSSKSKQQKAGMLQPATLLELVVYQKPHHNLQRIKEFHPAYIYTSLQEEVVKNCIAMFSAEVLLRTLPEHAPIPEMFAFSYEYFCMLDASATSRVANFPLYFIIECSRLMGYEIKGSYSGDTPYINLKEGAFTHFPPSVASYLDNEDIKILSALLDANSLNEAGNIEMNAPMRYRLLEWYIEFLYLHTQHTGNIKSLGILRSVLH